MKYFLPFIAEVQGRVVRKPVNVNPELNVNGSIIFSCLKMFLTYNVWFN